MSSHETMYDTVCDLLKYADPEGRNYKQLLKIKDQIERNVMLGPKSRAFIKKLVSIKEDDIECQNLTRNGKCKKRKRSCDYVGDGKKFSDCTDFARIRFKVDRNLGPLGGL